MMNLTRWSGVWGALLLAAGLAHAQGEGLAQGIEQTVNDELVQAVQQSLGHSEDPMARALEQEVAGQIVQAVRGSSAQVENSNQTKTVVCAAGEKLSLMGDMNDITVTGECDEVSVVGDSNKVQIEALNAIRIAGQSNLVTYERLYQVDALDSAIVGQDSLVTRAD